MLSEDLRKIEGVNPLDQKLSLNNKPKRHEAMIDEGDSEVPTGDFQPTTGQTKAIVVIPIKNEESGFVVQKDVETTLECHIPPSAANGRWSATMMGSSLVRGPMGCGSGSLLVHYAAIPKKIMLTTGATVGDDANMTYGCSYNTRNQNHSLSLVLPTSDPRGLVFKTTQNLRACIISNTLNIKQHQTLPDLEVSIKSKTRLPVNAAISLCGRKGKPSKFQVQVCPLQSRKTKSKLSLSWKNGWSLEMALNQMLGNKHSWVGLAVKHSRKGLSWIFSFIRGNISIHVPVTIAPVSYDFTYAMQGVSLSLLSGMVHEAVKELWGPSGDRNKEIQQTELHLKKGKAKAEAQQQKDLMMKQAKMRTKVEDDKAGLVIKNAIYWVPGGDTWDVTTQLQFWVNESTLALPASSKRDLLGFYDVSADSLQAKEGSASWWSGFFKILEPKHVHVNKVPKLRVEYNYNDSPFWIVISDNDPLSLPSKDGVIMPENTVQ